MFRYIYIVFFFLFVDSFSQEYTINEYNGQTINTCSGNFYDSGGPTGVYSANEDYTITICPENDLQLIELDFTSFTSQPVQNGNGDGLEIYDGVNTSAPLINMYSGTNSNSGPGFITASNDSGCLTFRFFSNNAAQAGGWEAVISCFEPCQDVFSEISSNPSANTNGSLEVDVDENISFLGLGEFSNGISENASYDWDFGNGSTAIGETVSFSYANAGIYEVSLVITDYNDCSSNTSEIQVIVGATTPGNPYVSAGDDFSIVCETNISLSADFLEIGETNTYNIVEIPFVPPFPFNGLSNSVNTNIDDAWDSPQALPFDFCFFGNLEQQFQVGSNGLVRFDVNASDTGGGSNAYSFSSANNIPANNPDAIGEGNIFSPVHDIDPAASNAEEIRWEILGEFPNRVLAVSFYNVEMFSCSDLFATHMIVLYETTNVIDIYIQNKPTCNSWQGGVAAVGIQNNAGNQGFVPPGRNSSDSPWTTQEEAWRFTPAGEPILTFEWLNSFGEVISTNPEIDIAINDTQTYTAKVTYTTCTGNPIVVEDNITITVEEPPYVVDIITEVVNSDEVFNSDIVDLCDDTLPLILDAQYESETATYQWFLNNNQIDNQNSQLAITSSTSGEYQVVVEDDECIVSDEVIINFGNPDNSLFEMAGTCDGGVANILGVAGGSFSFNIIPDDGAIIDPDLGIISGGSYETTYSVLYTTNDTCPSSSVVEVTSLSEDSPLEITDPSPLEVCDDNIPDGLVEIDLSLKNSEITNGNPNYSVSYFFNENDALNNINPLPNNYTNISNPQTIYVRVYDLISNCSATTSLLLSVIYAPSATSPPDLKYCDPDADGFGVFDLTSYNDIISQGQSGLTISYHETEADAENNVNAIVNADEYNNIVADEQTVYIRIESSSVATECGTILSMNLIVNDVPQINTEPSSLSLCDENADGFGIFDLSTSSEELLNGLDPNDFTITYYEAEDDAENALNAIVTPYNYTNTTAFNQFVWVRIENNITACYNLGSIELIINELPILTQPSPLNLCDDNNNGDEVEGFTLEDSIGEVLQGQTGINISFHESQEDADNAVNPIVSPYNNTANAQTIYIRGEDEITGCYATITLDLRVNPIPSPITPEPIEECDDDNDGFTFFTLETNEEEIINGELDIILSYYSTLTNAQNDVNPIISPYYNIVPDNQIIYVRAENELTGCFTIVEQELITIPSPEIPLIIEDIVICDDDYDDIALFDLTQREEDILGEQSSSEVILTYHESLLDAETGDNPIINTTSYQNLSNPQTIYVRLEDTVNGCINTGTFNLVVTLPPVIVQADPLQVCDDEIADQITEFDLTIKDSEITGGNIDWEVIYYETQQDAFNAINPIENPEAYSNTSVQGNPANPQTLYVAVVNEFGCIAYNYLTIEVLPNPTPNLDPSNIEQCDNNNAGDLTETFDITIHEDYILNGESGVSIAYHESLDDALSGINPITGPSNYVNVIPGVQTIYVAVTKNITGCVTVVTFDIIVNPLPDISSVADIVICEVNTDNIYDFDLDEITVQLLGSQDISNFTVTYHETQQDAEDGLNVLTSPYTNTTSPQQLFVNISNNTTGCFVTGAGFTLDVQEAAVANTDAEPALLEECDIDNDGFAQFILTGLNQDILDGLDANDFTVGYYENLQDAEDSSNALPNNYTNTSSPQIIYVRLDNDTDPSSQCYDITTATLIVNELPFFSLEASYMGCENANGSEVVDSLMETNFPESEYDFEWYDPTGTLVATTSSYFPTMAGTYTATVTNELTGCQFSTTTEVYTSATAVVSATVTTLAFAQEHVIQATATGIGDYEFRLDTGPWQLDGTFNNVSPGLHTVYVRDLNGCGMGTATVLVVDYPRFFTPNGDGYNDTWHIIGADLHPGLVTSDIYIFDRYGKLLKKLDPQGDGWDGTYNGRPMPSTDYWFTIEYQIPALNVTRRFRAHFSLKR
jgi:gliding motility-associated-like protein